MDSFTESILIPGFWGALCGAVIEPFWASLITVIIGIFLWSYITHYFFDEKISTEQPH
jgi:hypothetical protein